MCPYLVPNEKKKIERYMKGFPERIKGNFTSARPTTLHEAINLARELVEQAVQGKAARANENNKRKWEEQITQTIVTATATTTISTTSRLEGKRLLGPMLQPQLRGDDIEAYNNHFHNLALMCHDLVQNEKKKIKRYIRGFPKRIKGNITSLRLITLYDAINMARELVEQAV
nr:reverse transcriptase domain-containing protein [Tanacetum cinerariifolium]